MDSFSGLESFVRAADLLSFAEAGRALGISASAVGKNVARLEQQLGLRLFHRTTRQVRLTQEGTLFHERCRRILDHDTCCHHRGSQNASRTRQLHAGHEYQRSQRDYWRCG